MASENSIASVENEVLDIMNNPFLNALGNIMSDNKFSEFFEKNFSTLDDTKTTLIYMKLYKEIQDKHFEMHGKSIDKITCLQLIKYIMSSSELRPKVINAATSKYNIKNSISKVISDASMSNLLTMD
tara:strand:+ start:14602 stop:14982 length:381 start_codon:yes stop_codon:yes gene_type:complete